MFGKDYALKTLSVVMAASLLIICLMLTIEAQGPSQEASVYDRFRPSSGHDSQSVTTTNLAVQSAPLLKFAPVSFISSQLTSTIVTRNLTLKNAGSDQLIWTIPSSESADLNARPDPFSPTLARVGQRRQIFHGPPQVVIVPDPGFEGGTPNRYWREASINFGSVICDVVSCGSGGGTGPHTGNFWAWFGGIPAFEESHLSTQVTIPVGATALTFYLEQIFCDSNNDFLEVLIDDTRVFYTDGGSSLCENEGYVLQNADIGMFADDQEHTLEFHAMTFATNGRRSNFFVDDLQIGEPSATDCTDQAITPWLRISPLSGQINAGDEARISLTFDTTGLRSRHAQTATLCIESNDPLSPRINVPINVSILDPSLAFTKTVGPDAGVCASTRELVVSVDTNVTYCYLVKNTGNVILPDHQATDSEFGMLFPGQDMVRLNLQPGKTFTTLRSMPVQQTMASTATWAAFGEDFHIDESDIVTVSVRNAGLSIEKSVMPEADVPRHGVVTYSIMLLNSGQTDANDVIMLDTLPAATEFARWITKPPGATVGGSPVQINWFGAVAKNQDVTFRFSVTHTGEFEDIIENTARFSHDNLNGSDTATFAVEADFVSIDYKAYLPLLVR